LADLTTQSNYDGPLPETGYSLVGQEEAIPISDELIRTFENLQNQKKFNTEYHELKEVVVSSKQKSPTQLLDEKLSSGRFYNPREQVFDFVNEKQVGTETTIYGWLISRVAGDNKKWTYYIDEFPVSLQDIKSISMSGVALIKVQGRGDSHQIFIYNMKGGEILSKAKAMKTVNIQGYEKQNYC